MFKHEGHEIGDAWYFVDETTDTVHMFYLADPLDGGKDFAGHAISKDLVNWERIRPAIKTGPPGAWDDLRICTGSTIERDGRYWMAYSATNLSDSSWEELHRVQRVGMAVSDDLMTWTKLPENPVSEAGPPHYEEMGTGQRPMVHWRDPFLLDQGNALYQFICARGNEGESGQRGTVAVSRSTNLRKWEVLPPLEHVRIADEMEVPQLYHIDGRWYLVFVTVSRFLTPEFATRFCDELPLRTNYSMVADNPFGPFRIHGTGQIIKHPPDKIFYAAQLVALEGQWYLLATEKDEDGSRISDPVPVYADEKGIHELQ
jgi:beta-fructofuranosidase